jgi:hypothetical protein
MVVQVRNVLLEAQLLAGMHLLCLLHIQRLEGQMQAGLQLLSKCLAFALTTILTTAV